AAATVQVRPTLRPAPLGSLQQPRLGCGAANFRARIHGTVANRFGLQQRLGFGLRLFQFQLFRFALFGFQRGFGNRFAVRRLAGCQRWSHLSDSGLRQLPSGRARLFLQFLEARVISEFFSVGREIGFFFLDLLFLQGAVCGFVCSLVCTLRRRHQVRFPRCLKCRCLGRRVSLQYDSHLVPEFRYLRCYVGSGSVLFFINFCFGHMLMLLVERFGNLRRKDRFIFRKAGNDGGRNRRQRSRRCCALRWQSWTLILTLPLPLVLRDRFAGKHDRLISGRRSVIVVVPGPRRRRRGPLESRVRPAAAGTVAPAKAVVSRFTPRFVADFATGFSADFASNFDALRTVASICTRSTPYFSTTSAASAASAKVARSASAAARRFRSSRFRLFPLARYAAGFGKLPFIIRRWSTCFYTGPRTNLAHWTIRRNGFIQVLVRLFQIHEIGDVQKRVAFQSNVHKGRLHAWQHARHPALINRAG